MTISKVTAGCHEPGKVRIPMQGFYRSWRKVPPIPAASKVPPRERQRHIFRLFEQTDIQLGEAKRNWKALLGWMARCRLEPRIKVGKMVRNYLSGIPNAIMLRVTNAIAESVNATIQRIKARTCGFRNRSRFMAAILFHKSGLSLYPLGVLGTYPHKRPKQEFGISFTYKDLFISICILTAEETEVYKCIGYFLSLF